MDTQQIIAALSEERDRLEQAISALEGGGGRGRRGRRPGPVPAGPGRGRGRRRRRLSAAAKQRISEMMKKRWAERKKAAKGGRA
jgi:hypothetical protein